MDYLDPSKSIKQYKGELDQPENSRFGIVVSRYYQTIADNLLDGCLEVLGNHKVDQIDVTWVPGAYELPVGAAHMIDNRRYDALIALGVIIRGQTYHFELISQACVRGLDRVVRDSGVYISLGLITTDNLQQALVRSAPGPKNKGREAGLAALEMGSLLRIIYDEETGFEPD